MTITVIPHDSIKKPIVDVLYNNQVLAYLIAGDESGDESITEGWHPPSRDIIHYPYITYRMDWTKRAPLGFVNITFMLDIWDAEGNGNSLQTVEDISTELTNIFDGTVLIDGLIVIRCRVTTDTWIYDENDLSHIHKQIIVDMNTIDLYSA